MDRLRKQFLELFDLPPEVVLDLPLVMMVGQNRFYLENHKGIVQYTSKRIKIKTKNCYLVLEGVELSIDEIRLDNMIISGKVTALFYEVYGGNHS